MIPPFWVLGLIKQYAQQSAHGGRNKKEAWGGIPIVILVGDDYQLPPIMPWAFYALCPDSAPNEKKKLTPAQLKLRAEGFSEFLEFGKKTLFLEGEKRVNDDQEGFKRILRAVRSESDNDKMTENDFERLLELDIKHKSFSPQQKDRFARRSNLHFCKQGTSKQTKQYETEIYKFKVESGCKDQVKNC